MKSTRKRVPCKDCMPEMETKMCGLPKLPGKGKSHYNQEQNQFGSHEKYT